MAEGGGLGLYAYTLNQVPGAIDPLGTCTVTPEPFKYDRDVEEKVERLDPGQTGNTRFRREFNCDCRFCRPEGRAGYWWIDCKIKILTPVRIFRTPTARSRGAGFFEGVLGHEQVHVRNYLVYVYALKTAATECERRHFDTWTDCDAGLQEMRRKESDLANTFWRREELHRNFVHPLDGQGYHPQGMLGPIAPGNEPFPGPAIPDNSGIADSGFLAPTAPRLCGGGASR